MRQQAESPVAVPSPGSGGRRHAALRRLGRSLRRFDLAALLLVPTLALLAVFFVFPVGKIIGRAFTDHTSSPGGAFANLSWFFGDPTQVTILIRTFQTSFIVTAICLVVGYPYAYLLTIVGRRLQVLMLGIVIISCWQSILVRNYAWRILERENGVINDVLVFLGFNRVELLGTTRGVIIGMAHVMAPFMILPLYASMRTIDRRLLLAARSLGASPATAFRKVYFPLSLPGVMSGCLLVFVLSLGFYITPALLGSPDNSLVSQAIVLQINRLLDWGHAGAMSFVLLVTTLILLGLTAWATRRRLAIVGGGGGSR
jgi:putative spermidine/putrescine transport system permease protein